MIQQRIWQRICAFFTTLELNKWTPLRRIDPKAKLDNAQQAQMILANPVFMAVVESLAKKYRSKWESAQPSDWDTQRTAHLQFTALNDVLKEFRGHLSSARLMQLDLEARQKREAAKSEIFTEA